MIKVDKMLIQKELRLSDAIYYKKLLDYIPNEWDFEDTLNKKAKDLSQLEISRIFMVKKYYNSKLLLEQAIEKMNNENIDSLLFDSDVYDQIMKFDIDEIIDMKFKDDIEYKKYMVQARCDEPRVSILDEGISMEDIGTITPGIKSKTSFQRQIHNRRRY